MDIHLQSSRYLYIFRLVVFVMASCAVAIANIHLYLTIALILLLCCQLLWMHRKQTPVHRLQVVQALYPEEGESRQQIILELEQTAAGMRRIEVRLERFYCLWWLQLLYFRSSGRSIQVLVLPDSCSSDEQRQIRKYLHSAV